MKNTLLAKTLGGGVKESSFNSKKIVLSLATISFLASYANATSDTNACPTTNTRSGSSSSTEPYNKTLSSHCSDKTITIPNSGTSTLTITQGGTLMNSSTTVNHSSAIVLKGSGSTNATLEKLINQGFIKGDIGIENGNSNFSGTISIENFSNEGTIKGKVGMQVNGDQNTGSVIVNTFHNKGGGTIDGRVYYGWSKDGTISIETFNNEGTINYNNTSNGGKAAVEFEKINVTIKTFSNSGTIKSEHGQGVYFEGNVHVGTFENKSGGTIQAPGNQYAIVLRRSNGTTTLENFNNEGFIKGDIAIVSADSGTITVKTFENKKTIDGYIFMPTGTLNKGTISIEKFTNEGTITSNNKNYPAVYFQGNNVHIKTFENTGFISGRGDNLIHFQHKNFNVSGGVSMAGGTIETFKNSGTIQSTGAKNNPAGVKLNFVTVNTFENTGFISGTIGVLATQGTIETFKNSGTIEATGKDGGKAAIQIRSAFEKFSSITHFTNEGIIKSSSNGVLIESGDKIGTLTNKGTIETELNGIGFYNYTGSEETHLGKIVLEPDSSIKAGKNGINIDNQTTARSIKVGGIEVQEGASVSGDEAGIYLGKDKEITAPITISGTVSGGNAGIVNEGRMARGIVHEGEGELVISNQGLVDKGDDGNTVTNNSGSVTIKDWVVTTDDETGRLRTVVVGGKKTDEVKVSNITVDQSGLELEELNEIKNLVSGVSTNNIANVKTNGGGEISLSYDPISARLSTDVQLNASIAGANFRSSVATASKRATFIDNVMANAMQSFSLDSSGKSQKIALSEKGNLYADASDYIKNDYIKNDYIKSDLTQANYGLNKEHALF
ncbi:autotransporter outer membrane beta-barrel domain-containing protein, partial [Campylobacter jejuni]|nr:autotransporter outer membrane beta-barrel domain-containing protein [Campylobacter jejuni]